MMRRLACIFSLLCCLHQVSAQDSLVTKHKGGVGMELLFDLNSLIAFASDTQEKLEGAVSVTNGRLRFEIEAGTATLTPNYPFENGAYKSNGFYYRFGPDYSVPLTANSKLFLGLRYAQSRFDDQGEYLLGSVLWGDVTRTFARENLSAQWFEIILGSEAKLSKAPESFGSRFLIGWKLRVRKIIEYDEQATPDVYSIPGYGRTINNTSYGLNLHLRYDLFGGD